MTSRKFSLIIALVFVITAMLPATSKATVAGSFTGNGIVQPAAGGSYATAWQWNASWVGAYRSAYTRVYIQPFATGWSWTWTLDRGWLAMRSTDLGYAMATKSTLRAVGSPPMSDAQATAHVRRSTWEPRPENAAANRYVPSSSEISTFRARDPYDSWAGKVTGNCGLSNPTTDEIIQWASWKWGLDEDFERAQAMNESSWSQAAIGDAGMSFGLLQIKDHLPSGAPIHPGTWPLSQKSTCFNADFAMGMVRYAFDRKGDIWQAYAYFFDGAYGTSGGYTYIANVQRNLASRSWLSM